jgi:anti-sigma B factor antagonist
MMEFDHLIKENGPVRGVKVEGEKAEVDLSSDIDMNCSPIVREVLMELMLKQIPEIGIRLDNVSYMDSSGLATLVEALQKVKKYNGRLVLYNPQKRVQSVFEIAKLNQIFDIRKT